MTGALASYLDSIKYNLRLELSVAREIMDELETHIEDKLQDLEKSGLSEEEAASTCIRLLGSAKLVARQIYEAHSQGTWRQALLASAPHIIFGLMFGLNWWYGAGWIPIMLVLVITTVIYGWWHGKPAWLFPWQGYSLLPVVAAGIFLLYLPRGWSWLAILVYIPLAVWLLYTIIQTIKRGWLCASLMLLPVPVIIGLFLSVGSEGFPDFNHDEIYNFAPWIGLSFVALGISVAVFIRLRQRWLEVSVLLAGGLLTLTAVAYYVGDRLGLSAFLFLTLVMFGLFLAPALLERRIRRGLR